MPEGPDPYPRLPYPEGDSRELCEAGHWAAFIIAAEACENEANPEQCKNDAYGAYKTARDECPIN